MIITYLGHSSVMLEASGIKLLFDPFISYNSLAAHIRLEELRPDYVLLSHGHQDHIADAAQIIAQSGATLIANYEVATWFAKHHGIEQHVGMNIGGKYTLKKGISVKMLVAQHSSTLPDGSNGGSPAGFLIRSGKKCVYFAGDTALTMDMKLIADMAEVDLAILPIGDHFTMDARDAAKACQFVGCQKALGVHYDTFPPIRIDKQAALKAFSEKGLKLLLLPIGDSLEL